MHALVWNVIVVSRVWARFEENSFYIRQLKSISHIILDIRHHGPWTLTSAPSSSMHATVWNVIVVARVWAWFGRVDPRTKYLVRYDIGSTSHVTNRFLETKPWDILGLCTWYGIQYSPPSFCVDGTN